MLIQMKLCWSSDNFWKQVARLFEIFLHVFVVRGEFTLVENQGPLHRRGQVAGLQRTAEISGRGYKGSQEPGDFLWRGRFDIR